MTRRRVVHEQQAIGGVTLGGEREPANGTVLAPAEEPRGPVVISGPAVVSEHAAVHTVTVTWGKELFSPAKFHTYEVGPFTETAPVLPGETIEQARARLHASVTAFAEVERVRKRDSYLRAMREVGLSTSSES